MTRGELEQLHKQQREVVESAAALYRRQISLLNYVESLLERDDMEEAVKRVGIEDR